MDRLAFERRRDEISEEIDEIMHQRDEIRVVRAEQFTGFLRADLIAVNARGYVKLGQLAALGVQALPMRAMEWLEKKHEGRQE